MTAIAIAAGFKSIRSFNRTLQKAYGCKPTQLRRHQRTAAPTDPITLKLSFSSPYSWEAIAAFRQGRATPGLTVATAARYCRTIELEGHQGWISVEPITGQNYLLARIAFPKVT